MKKLWIRISLSIVVFLVALAVAVPFLVNAEAFRPLLQSTLSQALGRPVTFGRLSFSVLSGSVEAGDIAIADDPAFGATPFLQAKNLEIGVELMPLLLHRQLHVTQLTIEAPSIQLIQSGQGGWNFSSLGAATGASAPPTGTVPGGLTVQSLRIINGSASVTTLAARRAPFVYSGIELDLDGFSFDRGFPFEVKAQLPEQGTVEVKGSFGPLASGDLAETPFDAALSIGHFDPVAAGVVDRNAGLTMLLDVKARLASDGKALTSSGQIQAQRLHLARTGRPARPTVALDYNLALQLATRAGQVNDLAIHAGPAVARIKGSFHLTENGAQLDLRLSAPNLPIDALEELLPAAGITLPQGSKLVGGTLTANLTLQGPAAGMTIAGPVAVDNTRLAGFDIGSRLEGINPFGGKGGGTSIQTLRANLVSTPALTRLDQIYANLPQVGTASGSGTITASEQLDFNLTANFDPATGIGAVAAKTVQNAMNNLMGRLGGWGQKLAKPQGGIPVAITGTASNPSIRVKFKEMF